MGSIPRHYLKCENLSVGRILLSDLVLW